MANRFRNFIESIVYAGMKPGSKAGDTHPARSGLFAPLERFLSAPAPTDPLYLTNQTLAHKALRILVITIPLLAVIAAILMAINAYAPHTAKRAKELTPAEVAARILPNFNKDIKLDSNKDIEVQEVHFQHTGVSLMLGDLRNKSDHVIHEATVTFDLTDDTGSQLGAITITEANLEPGTVRKFQKPIEQKTAAYAVVRDVHSH